SPPGTGEKFTMTQRENASFVSFVCELRCNPPREMGLSCSETGGSHVLSRCTEPLPGRRAIQCSCCPGSTEDQRQGHWPQQPDASVDPRRVAVLAQNDPRGVEGRHHRGHHAARPD